MTPKRFGISRIYEDGDDNEGDNEGGAEEERAFRCKLISNEFKKRRKVTDYCINHNECLLYLESSSRRTYTCSCSLGRNLPVQRIF